MTTDNDWFEIEKLHRAAEDGDLDSVRQLVATGYDVNAYDDLSFTPLHYAAREGHIPVIRFLIETGADVNAHNEEKIGETPLGEVSANCSMEVATILVEAGADPTIPGWMRITALHRASERKKPEGIKVYQYLKHTARNVG